VPNSSASRSNLGAPLNRGESSIIGNTGAEPKDVSNELNFSELKCLFPEEEEGGWEGKEEEEGWEEAAGIEEEEAGEGVVSGPKGEESKKSLDWVLVPQSLSGLEVELLAGATTDEEGEGAGEKLKVLRGLERMES
jgi:hypothetical protein